MTQLASRTRSFGVLARVALIHDVWQQRRALRGLEDTQLKDLGLTRSLAHEESQRPLWDLPRHAQRADVWDVPPHWCQKAGI
ncbi:MAG: DUF1127 domain-containing protein [Pseudoruegeria sp.]